MQESVELRRRFSCRGMRNVFLEFLQLVSQSFHRVDSDLVCFENPSQSTHDSIPGPVDDFLKLDHMQSCFESAISFRAGRTRSMKLDAQFDIMYQRWTAIVLMNPMASSSGRMLAEFKHAFGDDWGKCCKVVAQYLGGKSVATLKKRYGQVSRYIAYVETELFSAPFPLVKHVVFDYLNSLAEKDEFSATQGFVECLNFLQHVLGSMCLSIFWRTHGYRVF